MIGLMAARRPARLSMGRTAVLANPINVSWERVFQSPISAANAFAIGVTQSTGGEREEYVLSIGFLPPPPLVGSPKEQLAQAEKLKQVEVMPVARLTFSRKRLAELSALLQSVLDATK
jgi:hypothetical protein